MEYYVLLAGANFLFLLGCTIYDFTAVAKDPYYYERQWYKTYGEFPDYVYDVMARSGENEADVRRIMNIKPR